MDDALRDSSIHGKWMDVEETIETLELILTDQTKNYTLSTFPSFSFVFTLEKKQEKTEKLFTLYSL